MIRRVVAATTSILLLGTFVMVAAAPADAAAYRFWSYWKGSSGSWVFSQIGAGVRLTDGAVEGWRFAVSPDSAHALKPRFDAANAFASQCGSVPADPSKVRVAVVVDYGTPDHAPSGQSPPGGPTGWCAVLPANATGYDALAHSTSYRSEGGLICGITGYPVGECGVVVDTPAPPPPSPPSPPAPAPAPPPPQSSTSAPPASSSPPRAAASTTSAPASTPVAGPSTPQAPAPSSTPTDATPTMAAAIPSASSAPDPSSEEERSSLAPVPVASRDRAGEGPPVGLLVGGVLIAGLVAAAWWQTRRRQGGASP